MPRRFQFSLRALLVLMTLAAVAAGTLPLWIHYLGYVIFLAGVAKIVIAEATLKGTLMAFLTLGIPATVVGVLGWALVVALRENCR
jgi:hypothetical protein